MKQKQRIVNTLFVAFGVTDAEERLIAEWTEADVLAAFQSKYPDATVDAFENGLDINGREAFVASVNLSTPGGSAVTILEALFAVSVSATRSASTSRMRRQRQFVYRRVARWKQNISWKPTVNRMNRTYIYSAFLI